MNMANVMLAASGNMIILGAVFLGVLALFVVGAIVFSKKSAGSERLSGYGRQHAESAGKVEISEQKEAELQTAMAERVLKPLSHIAALSGGSQTKVVERLVYAGIRRKGAAELFLGAKAALSISLPLAIASIMVLQAHRAGKPLDPGKLFLYCPIGLVMGLMLPNIWLGQKVKKRQENIKFSLPDALDLLVVCVESGLALDAALVRIGRELQHSAPELSEELALLNLEVSAGKPREDCLRNLGLRTGVEELKSLTARIIQSMKFGVNLGHSLRIHADSLREKRRQEAEERAAKTTVKLLFPLVFFIFPALFVVILGPAVVTVLKQFGH